MGRLLLAALVWVGLAGGAWAQVTPTIDVSVQVAGIDQNHGNATISTAGPNRIIVLFGAVDFGNTCSGGTTVTDTAALTWHRIDTSACSVKSQRMWWAFAAAQLTNDVITMTAVTSGVSSFPQGWIYALAGSGNTTAPFDASFLGAPRASSGNTTTTLTTTTVNDLILCGYLGPNNPPTGAGVITQDGTNFDQWYGHKNLTGTISGTTYQLVTDSGGSNECIALIGDVAPTGLSRLIQ